MTKQTESCERPVRNRQRGQSLALVAALLPVLLAMAALSIDLGYAYLSYQQLLAATRAAALAGGAAIPNTAPPYASTVALSYSALTGDLNAHGNLQNVSFSYSFACVPPSSYPGLGIPPCALYPICPSGCNMIQVQSTATVRTFFAKIFGVTSVPLSATAVASAKGGQVPPYHVMMVMDATGSMGQGLDTGCTQSGMSVSPEQCAEYGIQTLLLQLDPCSVSLAVCSPGSGPGTSQNPDDQVGLMIFPGICSSTAGGVTTGNCPVLAAGSTLTNTVANTTYAPHEYVCPPTAVPWAAYNNNPEYLILGFQSNYRFSDTSGLNTGSNLFKSVGVGTNNCGIVTANAYNTFYAGAMQAAQDYLTNNNTPGVQNVIIILSDGDANANNSGAGQSMHGNVAQVDGPNAGFVYKPLDGCEQAVQAATYAKNQGTLIYSVSYGSETTGCSTDQPGYVSGGVHGDGNYPTPCSTMQGMSSLPLSQYFYSIPMNDSSNPTQVTICPNAVPITTLNQVFSTIAAQLTVSRLVPNGVF